MFLIFSMGKSWVSGSPVLKVIGPRKLQYPNGWALAEFKKVSLQIEELVFGDKSASLAALA